MDPTKEQSKEKNDQNFIYKSCTTRSDRDAYRICPSKLTKRELEDLYFTVLEENMEQKKTINGQQDRIKSLTSKVHRMFSAQKVHQADERKECCVSKCMMDQHKQSLLDMKRTNERMAERIRQLNQQLISAKQVSKNRLLCTPKCPRSSPASPNLAEDLSTKSVETQTDSPSISQECDENKCRILMDELKQKIASLEEELANTHNEYSNRLSRLELEISQFRNQETLIRRGYDFPPELQQDLNRLETVDGINEPADLKKELLIEKAKVIELANQLKSAEAASSSKTPENNLSTIQEQASDENKECEGFSWDCNCIPVCPHSKPVCTVLRLFNKGSLCSAKHTCSVEVKTTNKINGLVTAGSQDSTNNHGLENERNGKNQKDLPEPMLTDSINFDSTNALKNKPKIEQNILSVDNDNQAKRLVDNLENNLVIEPTDNGISLHKNTTVGAEYNTLPGIEYKDLPDETLFQNAIDVAIRDDIPQNGIISNNLSEVPNAQVIQPQDWTYLNKTQIISTITEDQNARTSIDMHVDKNVPKLNEIQDQNNSKTALNYSRKVLPGDNQIDQVIPVQQNLPSTKIKTNLLDNAEHIDSDRSRGSNALKKRKENGRNNFNGDRSQPFNNRNGTVDDTNQRIEDTSQYDNGKDMHVDHKSQRINDRKQLIGERNQPVVDRNQHVDRITPLVDNKSQRIDNDKRTTSADSGQNVASPDKNKYRTERIGSTHMNLPETKFQREPGSDTSNQINYYHKCGCLTTKTPDTTDANILTDREKLLNTNGNRGSIEADIRNVPAYDSNQDYPYAKGVQNQTNLNNIEKYRNGTQHDASTSPYFPETSNRGGLTEADLIQDIPDQIRQDLPYAYEPYHQISSNEGQYEAAFQPNADRNLNITNTHTQGPTNVDINRNINTKPAYKNGLNFPNGVQNQVSHNIKKDRPQSKPDGYRNLNLVDTNQTQGRLDASMNYKNGQNLSNIYGPQNQASSNTGQEKVRTPLGPSKNVNVPNTGQEKVRTSLGPSKNVNLPATNQIQGKTEDDINRNIPVYKNGQDLHYAYGPNNQVSYNGRNDNAQTQPGVSRILNIPITNQIQGDSEKTMSNNIPAYKNGQKLPYAHGLQKKVNSNLDQSTVQPLTNIANVPNTNLNQSLTETYTPVYKNDQGLPYAYEPKNQLSSVIEQDKAHHDDSIRLNLPTANQFQGENETNISRIIPSYKNGQALPIIYQGQNQISSRIGQDKTQTQTDVKRNLNVPGTDQIQNVTEADMHYNIPAYQDAKDMTNAYGAPNQMSSNIGQNISQTQLDNNENVKMYDSNKGQGQIKADMISNIPAYKKGNDLPHVYEEPSQPTITYNKRQDTADTQLDAEGYLNLPKNGKTRDIATYDNGKNNTVTSDAQNQYEFVNNNYQNSTDNKNQRPAEAYSTYNNYGAYENGDSNLKKYNGQAKLDNQNQDVAAADSYLSDTSHGPNLIDSIKKHDVETQTYDDGKMNEFDAYSIKDPLVLAKNLTDISEAQLETIVELGRQFKAKKGLPVENDEINRLINENSQANEVDISNLSLNKGNALSKNDYTPTKVPAKYKTDNQFSKKLPRDSIWLSKQKISQEKSEKNRTNEIKTITPKSDQHNSLQIPGPIPSSSAQNSSWKANVLKRFNRDPKKRNVKESNKKTKETANNTVNQVDKGKEHEETSESEKDKDVYKSLEISEKVIKLGHKERVSHHNGLNSPTKSMADHETNMDPGALMVKCMELSMMQAAETLEESIQSEPIPELVASSNHDVKDNVPVPTQRELKTYRNEDGTLCFETKPVTDRTRCCQCDRKIHCEDYRSRDKQQEGKHRQIGTYEQGTSTTNSGEDAQCMALQKEEYRLYDTPPVPPVENDNTSKKRLSASSNKADNNILKEEMPPITESPMENKYASTEPETKNVREPVAYESNKFSTQKRLSIDVEIKEEPALVPAEDTTINGKRDLTPVPDPNTLPEGKMLFSHEQPAANATEVKKNVDTTSKSQSLLRMEEKLQALTEEIEHCKKLLFGQQSPYLKIQDAEEFIPEEKKDSKSALSEMDEEERQLALKRGVAMHTIGDTFTPHCVFTLHVGTIVLSDEAVLTTRDKSLILTWKFYNHNVSITRMSAGRVMLFDISSEYDVQITDEFLEYMKFEEMIISICELTNQNEAFATCALPLRDALLHTNRRADMSLELVAGPQMLYARDANQTSDSLDTGDEVGVIDLWCMLRVDTKLLPMIKKAMANQTVTPRKKKEEPRIKPLIDDDDDDDDKNRTHSDSQKFDESFQDMREMDNRKLHRWGSSILRLPSREWSQPAEYGTPKRGKNTGSSKKESAGASKVRDSLSSLKLFSRKRHKQLATQPEAKMQKSSRRGSTDIGTQVSYTSVTAQYDPSKYPLPRVDSIEALDKNKEKERLGHQSGILINEVIANIKTPEDMKHAMENTYRESIHKVSRLPRNDDDIVSQGHSGSTFNFIRSWKNKRSSYKGDKSNYKNSLTGSNKIREYSRDQDYQPPLVLAEEEPSDIELINRKYDNISKICIVRPDIKKQVTINANHRHADDIDLKEEPQKDEVDYADENDNMKFINQKVDITILWLALNEECEAMCNPKVQRVYVAYNFLGRSGADLETPFSLPKPKHHVDKCYFNFKKSFQVEEEDVSLLGHMARCRAASRLVTDFKDCIVFSVISEPPEDPLGLDTCEDIGYAYLYLGDLLAYSAGSAGYTEVIPVRARGGSSVCGVLAVRLDGLDVLRRCATLTAHEFVPTIE